MLQQPLLCGCGSSLLFRQGLCVRCYRRLRLSREKFGGLREQVLVRDGRRCPTCGLIDESKLLVHHRRKLSRLQWLATSCRHCHPRIHFTLRPKFGFPEALRVLWREQHRDLAEQLPLPLTAEGAPPPPFERQDEFFRDQPA